MSVLSNSEQRHVEKRPVGSKYVDAVEVLQNCFVRDGGLLRRQTLCRNRVNIGTGNRDSRKKRVTGHPIIAVRMIVRHEPFVAPKPMGPAPRKTRCDGRCCKPFIKPS